MQAQPQLVAQAPAGDAAPNLHDRLVFRLANANIANQCMQRTGEAASSTAALGAAVAANPNPRPVLYEPSVFTGNINPGAIVTIKPPPAHAAICANSGCTPCAQLTHRRWARRCDRERWPPLRCDLFLLCFPIAAHPLCSVDLRRLVCDS